MYCGCSGLLMCVIMKSFTQLKVLSNFSKFLDCSGFVPRHVDLLLTSECNLKCVMCNVWRFSKNSSDKKLNELSTTKIFSFLEEAVSLGTESVCISGGEPTLRSDLIQIIEKAKKEQLFVSLITNGTLIADELAKQLVSSGLDEIVFSIDSPKPDIHDTIRGVKGTYNKTVQGIKKISQLRSENKFSKPVISVYYSVSRITYKNIEEIIDLKSSLGFDAIHFLPLNPKTVRSKDLLLTHDDLKILWGLIPTFEKAITRNNLSLFSLSSLVYMCRNVEATVQGDFSVPIRSKISCFQPWILATIDPFGNVYPCCFACTLQNIKDENVQNVFSFDPYNMGNIDQKSFQEIWHGNKFKWFRNKVKKPLAFEMCYSCNYSVRNDTFLTGLFGKPHVLLKYFNELFRTSYNYSQVTSFIT